MSKLNPADKPTTPEETEAMHISKLYARFRRAEQAVTYKHSQFKILDQFDRGKQWENVAIPPWVPKPVANWIRYIRTLKRANLASAIPTASYAPRIQEQAPYIDKLYRAYKHVWEVEKIPRTIRRCIDRSILQGTAIAMVYTDDTFVGGQYYGSGDTKNALYQGKICVKRFPNTNFYHDPDVYRLPDCKFVETTETMALSTVKNNPKFKEFAGKKLNELTTQQLAMSDSESGDIFDRDIKLADNPGGAGHGDEMVTLHTHWERYVNEQGKWQMDITQYLTGATWALYKVEDHKPSVFPFAVMYDEEEENEFWGSSTAQDVLEMQKIINKTAQTASIIGALHQNPQKVVTKTSGINAKELARTGQMPGKVWTTNDGDPRMSIHYSETPDIPKGLFELEDRMKADIREMVGINEAYTGQSVGSLTTSTGVNSLIERATIRDKDKMMQIDEFVEQISDLILLNIMHKWQDSRPITTIGPDGIPQYDTYEPLDQSTIDNLEWICKSNVYAKAPTTQALRKQQADNLMQQQGQFQYNPPIITPEEWVRFQDFDMSEEMLRRMQKDRAQMEANKAQDMAQTITQVAQQIQELMAQGVSPVNAQQQALKFAQEITGKKEAEEAKNGISSAPAQPQPPQGTTGQMAMNAMAQGS